MKMFFIIAAVIVAAVFVSCQKQQTEAERNAEVERQVQERLAAEHQTQQQQQLDQRQADLDAREKALAEKENTAAATPAPRRERERSGSESYEPRVREPRERGMSVGYSTFYNKLEPYGDWIETGDYGYVFHPRQAENSRWRPYTDGHWVYTDAGWTWISEESFGWATYHYGRWTRLRGIGWVWVPGNQWAPAWVSWRKSPDYVGWAPLPPEARFDQRTGIHNWSDSYYDVGPDQYCFVASREFGAPRVERTLLPPERNVTIINQTTNVTNITYNNTTIVNEGPNYDELRSMSRERVQRYRLERNVNVDLTVGAPRSEVRGETVVIAAPVIAQPVANERPPTVKQTLTTAAIDLGWAAIANQEEAKKTRQKMKSEATAPPNAPPKKFVKAEAAATTTTQPAQSSATTPSAGASPATPESSAKARREGGPTSTAPTVAPSAATATTPVATATPESTMPPHRAATVAPTATANPTSSPMTSPTPSQRRGRLLVPNATPTPRAGLSATPKSTPVATPQSTPASSPITSETAPSKAMTPPAEASPTVPAQSPPAQTRGKFKSQTQQFQPRRVEPMQTASPLPSVGSTSSPPGASTPLTTPGEKLTKQEKKELRREQRQEMKRERREGAEAASPTPTP